MVVIIPDVFTLRMRALPASAIYTLPLASTATPSTSPRNVAAVAWPASPVKPLLPVPANVVITPTGVILRTRLSELVLTYRLPAASKAAAMGLASCAAVASPPSPENPKDVPATGLIIPCAAKVIGNGEPFTVSVVTA